MSGDDSDSKTFITVLVGSLAVALLSSVGAACFYVWRVFYDQIRRSFLVSVTITNEDAAFDWVLKYLAQHPELFLSAPKLKLKQFEDERSSHGRVDAEFDNAILPVPGDGMHVLRFKGRRIWMTRYTSNSPSTQGWDRKPFYPSALTFTCYRGFGSLADAQGVFDDLIVAARDNARACDEGRTRIYVMDRWAYRWTVALSQPPRGFESVVLDEGVAESILDDVRSFYASEDWYADRGIPYRRGLLLYGPPGTGKSSFALALASTLGRDLALVSLSSKGLTDEKLMRAINVAPRHAILLLEDVDAVFVGRTAVNSRKGDDAGGISFSGLLNALDGVASAGQGRLLLMSTNHRERLDPALIRPGRADVHVELGFATSFQVRRLFEIFFPGEAALAEELADLVPSDTISMAQLQSHLMRFRGTPLAAVRNVSMLLNDDYSTATRETVSSVADVTVPEWLTRLGLPQYQRVFSELGLRFFSDFANLEPKSLVDTLEIKHPVHKQRIIDMLKGVGYAKRGYSSATRADVRALFDLYFPSLGLAHTRETFINAVQDYDISIFQLQRYLAQAGSADDALARATTLGVINTAPGAAASASTGASPTVGALCVATDCCPPDCVSRVQSETVDAFLARMGVPEDDPTPLEEETLAALTADCGLGDDVLDKLTEARVTVSMLIAMLRADQLKMRELGITTAGDAWTLNAALRARHAARPRANLEAAGVHTMEDVLALKDADLRKYGFSKPVCTRIAKEIARLSKKESLRYDCPLAGAATPRYTPEGAHRTFLL